MWKLAALSAAMTVAGAGKFNAHLAEIGRQTALQDYLALRCGGGAPMPMPGAAAGDLLTLAAMHCWGCYAMAVGAALLAFALWQSARVPLKLLGGH